MNVLERKREGERNNKYSKTIKDIFDKNLLYLHLRVLCQKARPTHNYCIDCSSNNQLKG